MSRCKGRGTSIPVGWMYRKCVISTFFFFFFFYGYLTVSICRLFRNKEHHRWMVDECNPWYTTYVNNVTVSLDPRSILYIPYFTTVSKLYPYIVSIVYQPILRRESFKDPEGYPIHRRAFRTNPVLLTPGNNLSSNIVKEHA